MIPPDGREPTPLTQAVDVRLVFDSMLELAVFHEVVYGEGGDSIDYRILECNPAFTRIMGIPRDAVVGRLASEVYGTRPPYLDIYARVAATGQPTRFDTYFPPMDRHFSISVVSPRVGYFATIASDVTDRQRALDAVCRYELLAEHAHDIVLFVRREDGRIIDGNAAALAAYGYTRDELRSLTVFALRENATLGATTAQMASADERGILFETVHRRKDGSTFPVEVSSKGALQDGTRILVSVIRDISERKSAEARVAAERERLEVTLRSIGDAVIATDEFARVTLMNEVAEQLTGWRTEEAAGRPLREVFHILNEETREPALDPVERVLKEGCIVGLANHTVLVARDGTERPVADSCAPIRETGGRISGVVLVFRDKTEERKAEQVLRQSARRYRRFFENLAEEVTIYDLVRDDRGEIVDWAVREQNLQARKSLGRAEPLRGSRVTDVLGKEVALPFIERSREVMNTGRASAGEFHLELTDRDYHASLFRLDANTVVIAATDITERKRAQREREELQGQLAQAQKLESIGRLAGGIAHDFNNILTVILSCAEALRVDLGASAPGEVADMAAAGKRAQDLTRQLLTFARKQVIAPVPLDLDAVLRGSEKLLRRVLGEDVELVVSLQPGLWSTRCDPGQIEQVVLNLAVNARDAMPHGGRLTIETRNAQVGEHEVALDPERQLGEWVRLVIRDTGTGMSPEVQEHLFEPFFTTKPRGKGTGLGLATVYGIVKQSGGHVHVKTGLGQGTTFEICLPRSSELAVTAGPSQREESTGGTETVLVVEDDPHVREVTVRALRSSGYQVFVATNGREALAIDPAALQRTRLLITDVVMPGLNGRELADELRRRYPQLVALFVSGYTADAISERGVVEDRIEFLPKPFTATLLLARVRAVLDKH